MRTRRSRRAAAQLAVALLLCTACGDGTAAGPSGPSRTPSAIPSQPAAAGTAGAGPAPTAGASAQPPFDGTVVEVEVAGGQSRTAAPRVVVPLGERVRLEVTSDVDDEVHVHGVDEYVRLSPGATVTHEFTAGIPGIFEVELHDGGDLLFTLQVEP